MATNSSRLQQQQTTFQIIEPLFYTEFNENYPVFPDWTIERLPRSVNVRRIQLNKNNMSADGWFYKSYNTKGKFRCIRCIKAGAKEKDAIWSSAYTTVLFRAYYGPDTDEFGETWIGGWIQMKVFTQQCETCHEFITPELTNERPIHLVKWLHKWIANKFYGFSYRSSYYRGQRTNLYHHKDLCEACTDGWCAFPKMKQQYKKYT